MRKLSLGGVRDGRDGFWAGRELGNDQLWVVRKKLCTNSSWTSKHRIKKYSGKSNDSE